MSKSNKLYYGVGVNGLTFQSEKEAIRLVEKLTDHPAFCQWCLVPLKPDSPAEDIYLSTVGTYDLYSNPTRDTPPDRISEDGEMIESSRGKRTICECGVIDIAPGDTRNNQTVYQALQHICTLLEDNGANVDRQRARKVVKQKLDKGHTGQLAKNLGGAIYKATA